MVAGGWRFHDVAEYTTVVTAVCMTGVMANG